VTYDVGQIYILLLYKVY